MKFMYSNIIHEKKEWKMFHKNIQHLIILILHFIIRYRFCVILLFVRSDKPIYVSDFFSLCKKIYYSGTKMDFLRRRMRFLIGVMRIFLFYSGFFENIKGIMSIDFGLILHFLLNCRGFRGFLNRNSNLRNFNWNFFCRFGW